MQPPLSFIFIRQLLRNVTIGNVNLDKDTTIFP
jgi:hypothetical protein